MTNEEVVEILREFTHQEQSVFLFKHVLGFSIHQTALINHGKVNGRIRTAYKTLDERVSTKLESLGRHEDCIKWIQEIFTNRQSFY